MKCEYCGSREWVATPTGSHCSVCGLSPALAAKFAEADRVNAARQAEHRRRTALVLAATRTMPMRARLEAAVYLLHTNGRLPNGEPWDRMFEAWRTENGIAEQKALPV